MIQAHVEPRVYPAGPKVIVNSLPKQGEIIHVKNWGKMRVQTIDDRWGSKYIYLQSVYNKSVHIDAYIEVK